MILNKGVEMAKGYFEIRFRNKDKVIDEELRKQVVDYCKSNYEWFSKGIEEGQIKVDGVIESLNNNGLVESTVPDEALDEAWIRQIFEEFNPCDMKAVQLLGQGEFAEGPFSYRKFNTINLGSSYKLGCKEAPWDWIDGAVVEIESKHDGMIMEQSETLGRYYAAFTNKVNGHVAELYICIKNNKLFASNGLNLKSYLLDENNAEISCLDDFNHFDEKVMSVIKSRCKQWDGKKDDKNFENWEFMGMKVYDFWDKGRV